MEQSAFERGLAPGAHGLSRLDPWRPAVTRQGERVEPAKRASGGGSRSAWGSPPSSSLGASVKRLSKTEFSRVFVAAKVGSAVRGRDWPPAPLGDNGRQGTISREDPIGHRQERASMAIESMKHLESGDGFGKTLSGRSLVVGAPETLETRGVLQISALSQTTGPSLIVHWPDPGLTG